MTSRILLRVFIVILYTSLLFSLADTLSLSFFEVENFSEKDSILYYPLHFLTDIFGQKEVVLRAFMIALHLMSIYLFYKISKPHLEGQRDRLWNLILFILLPSIVSSAIIVHPSGLTLLLLLLFIYIFQKDEKKALYLLPFYLFVDISFFILFFALMFFYIARKRWFLVVMQLIFMAISIVLFGFISHGYPANYFIQMFGVSSLVFSPLLFLYYLYTMLRIGFRGNKDILWTLSTVSFMLMLFLSLRQRVTVEHFAPYMIVLLPLMVKQFMHAYRIRIRPLRRNYKILFAIALLFLVLNSLTVYFNRYLYFVLDDPKKHFLYEHYVVKELAQKLKAREQTHLFIEDNHLAKRLSFYGIENKNPIGILEKESCHNVTISYGPVEIASFCVTKNNTLIID